MPIFVNSVMITVTRFFPSNPKILLVNFFLTCGLPTITHYKSLARVRLWNNSFHLNFIQRFSTHDTLHFNQSSFFVWNVSNYLPISPDTRLIHWTFLFGILQYKQLIQLVYGYMHFVTSNSIYIYLLTYLLHAAESFLRS